MSAAGDERLALVVDTGRSNAASVIAALERAGARARLTTDASDIAAAPFVVLPGVGAFGPVMDRLRDSGLEATLRARVGAGRPTLGICLGMQLFFGSSEESRGARGLGALSGGVSRFQGGVRVPQFGWNCVRVPRGAGGILAGQGDGWAYFANSYKVDEAPAGWAAATADYGSPFVAAMEKGRALLCQFHPELSGDWGLALLRRWLDGPAAGNSRRPASGADDASAGGGDGSDGAVRALDAMGAPRLALPPRVIPCLDVKDGRVVKGVRFRGLADSGDPAELARRYEADGADELVMLDITAGVESQRTRIDMVRAVRRAVGVPLCVGGGVRSVADAERVLAAGADKVAVNSRGFREPGLLAAIAREFGRQACVAAVDASRRTGTSRRTDARSADDGRAMVVLDAGSTETDVPAADWIARAVDAGAGEILLTSRDRDGTRTGYDLPLLREAARAAAGTPVIASGGAATPGQILDGLEAGADAALLAGALHDGSLSIRDIKDSLRRAGVEVR